MRFIAETFQLGRGEASVSPSNEKKAIAIIDDEKARKVGKMLGIRIHGTLFLLKLLLLLGITSVDDLKKYLYQMVKEGFRFQRRSSSILLQISKKKAKRIPKLLIFYWSTYFRGYVRSKRFLHEVKTCFLLRRIFYSSQCCDYYFE